MLIRLTALPHTEEAKNPVGNAREPARAHELACVDFLRVVAALMVFLEHLDWAVSGNSHRAFFLGGWGVDCFFVLSGFLLGRPYARALIDGTPIPSTKEYFLRRFYRIWPLYAICVSFIFLRLAQAHPMLLAAYARELAAYLTMTQNFCGFCDQNDDYLMQMWTMAVDAQFYLLLPLLACVVRRLLGRWDHSSIPPHAIRFSGDKRTTRTRLMISLILMTIPLSLIARHWGYAAMLAAHSTDWSFHVRNIVGMSPAFALGFGLNLFNGSVPAHRKTKQTLFCAIIGITLLPLIQYTYDTPTLQVFSIYDILGSLSAACILNAFLQCSPAPRNLSSVAHAGETNTLWETALKGGFSRLLHANLMHRLAERTYSFYLLHVWVLHMVYYDIGRILYGHHGTWRFECEIGIVSLVVTLAVAGVAYHYLERPFLRQKERYRPHHVLGLPASAQMV